MIFNHDLKFYKEHATKLNKITDELQLLNPSRKYLAVKTRIGIIDILLKTFARQFNNSGLAMSKAHFMLVVKPVLAIREILVVEYDQLKPKEKFDIGGYTDSLHSALGGFIESSIDELKLRRELINKHKQNEKNPN